VKFWDASAVVPLVLREPGSELVRGWLREDPDMVLWVLSRLELVSAIERRTRERKLTPRQRALALARVARLTRDAHEVSDVVAARSRAVPLWRGILSELLIQLSWEPRCSSRNQNLHR
jgi:uncharacterized protein with PIN domain